MTLAVVLALVLAALVNAACAVFVAFRIDALIRFCRSDPELHPIRRMFNRVARRERVRTRGIEIRA